MLIDRLIWPVWCPDYRPSAMPSEPVSAPAFVRSVAWLVHQVAVLVGINAPALLPALWLVLRLLKVNSLFYLPPALGVVSLCDGPTVCLAVNSNHTPPQLRCAKWSGGSRADWQ